MAKTQKFDLDEKNIHAGHRRRLTATVHKVGLEGLSEIQILEYILFHIFPRGDTNPLAHRLLARFRNVTTVLEASMEDLMQVKGMGEASAQKLSSLLEIFNYYTFAKTFSNDCMKTAGEFYDYLEQLLRFKKQEELYLFGVNPSGEIIKGRCFGRGSLDAVQLDMKEVALYISTENVKAVMVVHNHPAGECQPSARDRESYQRLKGVFNFSGCKLLDSIIVGKDGIYSMERDTIARLFSDGVEYLQLILPELQQQEKKGC